MNKIKTVLKEVVAAWNVKADKFNQWADLGGEEQAELIVKCLLEKEAEKCCNTCEKLDHQISDFHDQCPIVEAITFFDSLYVDIDLDTFFCSEHEEKS